MFGFPRCSVVARESAEAAEISPFLLLTFVESDYNSRRLPSYLARLLHGMVLLSARVLRRGAIQLESTSGCQCPGFEGMSWPGGDVRI
jgi:hypothetical protein